MSLQQTDLDPLLKRLHLANTRRIWQDLVQRAEEEDWSCRQFLEVLLGEEVAHRQQTRLQRCTQQAKFPFLKTIDDFDFHLQSQVRLALLGSYLSPDFVTEGRNLILYGRSGRGKTHLAVAIAYRAIQNGFDALFTTAAALIDDLSRASHHGRFRDVLHRYTKVHVLVIDEVGYLSHGADAANVLYHVVNERHLARRPMVFTIMWNMPAGQVPGGCQVQSVHEWLRQAGSGRAVCGWPRWSVSRCNVVRSRSTAARWSSVSGSSCKKCSRLVFAARNWSRLASLAR